MIEFKYPDGLDKLRNSPLEQLAKQLHKEIQSEFQLWIRIEDFERKISFGIVNTNFTAIILLVRKGGRNCKEIDKSTLDEILKHLRSSDKNDQIKTLV